MLEIKFETSLQYISVASFSETQTRGSEGVVVFCGEVVDELPEEDELPVVLLPELLDESGLQSGFPSAEQSGLYLFLQYGTYKILVVLHSMELVFLLHVGFGISITPLLLDEVDI